MTIERAAITKEAMTWVGTKFQHQGRVKGRGVDCIGLIIGVATNVGYAPVVPNNYKQFPDHELLDAMCNQLLVKPKRQGLAKVLPGDIMAFSSVDTRYATHLAWAVMLGPRLAMLHVMSSGGANTCMHRIMPPWTTRYKATWCLPNTENIEG